MNPSLSENSLPARVVAAPSTTVALLGLLHNLQQESSLPTSQHCGHQGFILC